MSDPLEKDDEVFVEFHNDSSHYFRGATIDGLEANGLHLVLLHDPKKGEGKSLYVRR